MHNGWFIGDFVPAALKTSKFEVGLHSYPKDASTVNHYHKESTEINLIVEGKMKVNGKILSKGDIFLFNPYTVSESCFLSDTSLVVVRDASHPNDKHITK